MSNIIMPNQIPPTVHVMANGFPDAWYKAVKEYMKKLPEITILYIFIS